MVFGKTRKRIKDLTTVWKYRKRLEAQRKIYTQTSQAMSENDRKSRCMALGECALQNMEAVGALNLKHKLFPDSLHYMLTQQKVEDETGKKGFSYGVTYFVTADEPAYTQEQIRAEVETLAKQLKLETEELFGKEQAEDDGSGESSEMEKGES